MEYETLYEISKIQIPGDLLTSIGGVIIGTIVLVEVIREIRNKGFKLSNIATFLASTVVLIVFVMLLFGSIRYDGDEDICYSKRYYNGNYNIVEGEVRAFEKNVIVYYYVDDVYFRISKLDKTYSMIKENGQQVRISYIPYEQPMADGTFKKECQQILKLEIVQEDGVR